MRNLVIIVFVMFLFSNCIKIQQKESLKSITGNWKLEGKQSKFNSSINMFSKVLLNSVEISLKDNGLKGEISGKLRPNKLYGKYELSGQNKLSVISLGGNALEECNEMKEIREALYNASAYKCFENELFIYTQSEKEVLKFVRIN